MLCSHNMFLKVPCNDLFIPLRSWKVNGVERSRMATANKNYPLFHFLAKSTQNNGARKRYSYLWRFLKMMSCCDLLRQFGSHWVAYLKMEMVSITLWCTHKMLEDSCTICTEKAMASLLLLCPVIYCSMGKMFQKHDMISIFFIWKISKMGYGSRDTGSCETKVYLLPFISFIAYNLCDHQISKKEGNFRPNKSKE